LRAAAQNRQIDREIATIVDEIVKQAMAKWPTVPAVFGWLSLDRRGRWLIKGDLVSNPVLCEFIGRNYGHDEQGRWYFQNGPQRVFVALDYAPYVYHIVWNAEPQAPLRMQTHTGRPVSRLAGAWIDDAGVLLLETEHGPGVLDGRDLDLVLPYFTDKHGKPLTEEQAESALEKLQAGAPDPACLAYGSSIVLCGAIAARDIPLHFGFVQRPAPPAGHEVCS
jgi:hypothetical protein